MEEQTQYNENEIEQVLHENGADENCVIHGNRNEWIKQIIVILVTSFSTVLFTQMYFEDNVSTEAALNLKIQQYHIYNKVHNICSYDNLTYTEFTAPTIMRRYTVVLDQFKNIVERHEEVEKEVKTETFKIKAPSFMFVDEVYDKFHQDWEYVVAHRDQLLPEAYQIVVQLSDLFKQYPIPSKEKRIQEIATHWSKETVYSQYYKLINKLHRILEENCLVVK